MMSCRRLQWFGPPLVCVVGLVFGSSLRLRAGPDGIAPKPGIPASAVPPILREVGFDQRLNERVPLDLPFRDEAGRVAPLRQYFGRMPVVLALVYYDCPMLCTQTLNDLTGALKMLSLDAGRDFLVVAVSFDPRDTPALAAAKKQAYVARYGRQGGETGWHLLTGDEGSIRQLTAAVGFRYVYDAAIGQYAHPAGIMVLTPDGRVARYLYGIAYSPRDLRFALIEAAASKIGSPADRLLLYCYHYDPTRGRYGLVALRLIRVGGAITVLALGAFIVMMWRRERESPNTQQRPPGDPRPPSALSDKR